MNDRAPDPVGDIRKQSIESIRDLLDKADKARAFKLPPPPKRLEEYQQQLKENTCRVLVVGEAKRGKSQFVNALIGEELLPTGINIATAQAFWVRYARESAYRVHFVDGTVRSIDKGQLSSFGADRMIPLRGMIGRKKVISHIEVETPTWRLPPRIELLDTPGLGGLFSAHAEITQRFIPWANAVIFILDAGKTIIQPELEFIESILTITKHIFFIQTKIDLYDPPTWQAIKKLNEDVLHNTFKEELAHATIWPLSSKHLMRAYQTNDQDYLELSQYEELQMALLAFLARASESGPIRQALEVAKHYALEGLETLAIRLGSISQTSQDERDQWQAQLSRHKALFDADWGARGQKRQATEARISELTEKAVKRLHEAISANGEVEKLIQTTINSLDTKKKAEEYSKQLAGEVTGTLRTIWIEESEQLDQECALLVGPLLNAAAIHSSTTQLSIPVIPNQPESVKETLLTVFIKSSKDSFSTLSKILFEFTPVHEESPLSRTLLEALAALIWAAVRTLIWQLRSHQRQLDADLQQALNILRERLQKPQPEFGNKSYIQNYFEQRKNIILAEVQRIADQESSKLQDQLDQLAEERRLDARRREARIEQLERLRAQWRVLYTHIESFISNLERLRE